MKIKKNRWSISVLGSNKKQAKKMCAYEACRTLLNVEYPPEAFAANQYPSPAEKMQTS